MAKEEGFTHWKKLSGRLQIMRILKFLFCYWKALESSLGDGGIDKELQQANHKRRNRVIGKKYYILSGKTKNLVKGVTVTQEWHISKYS